MRPLAYKDAYPGATGKIPIRQTDHVNAVGRSESAHRRAAAEGKPMKSMDKGGAWRTNSGGGCVDPGGVKSKITVGRHAEGG